MSKKDYQNWLKEDLIKRVNELEKRKKYGLVWEHKPEDVVAMCKKCTFDVCKIFKSGELNKKSVCSKIEHTATI